MKTESALPAPFRVRVPVKYRLEVDAYTPATSVDPPRSPETVVNGVRDAASMYAAVKSRCAPNAEASAVWVTPDDWIPGGKPVIAVPGERPMSPVITDEPVLVMALPANTAKVEAVPRFTFVVAAPALGTAQTKAAKVLKLIANTPPIRGHRKRVALARFLSEDFCRDWAETP